MAVGALHDEILLCRVVDPIGCSLTLYCTNSFRLEILARGRLFMSSIHDVPGFAQRRVSNPNGVARSILRGTLYYHRSNLQ